MLQLTRQNYASIDHGDYLCVKSATLIYMLLVCIVTYQSENNDIIVPAKVLKHELSRINAQANDESC